MRIVRGIAALLMGGLLAGGVLLAGCATGTTLETPSSGDHPDTTAYTLGTATTATAATVQPPRRMDEVHGRRH